MSFEEQSNIYLYIQTENHGFLYLDKSILINLSLVELDRKPRLDISIEDQFLNKNNTSSLDGTTYDSYKKETKRSIKLIKKWNLL